MEVTVCLPYSGRDQLLPSQEEGERLRLALSQCQIRRFNDSGHALFLVKILLLSVLLECIACIIFHVSDQRSYNQASETFLLLFVPYSDVLAFLLKLMRVFASLLHNFT